MSNWLEEQDEGRGMKERVGSGVSGDPWERPEVLGFSGKVSLQKWHRSIGSVPAFIREAVGTPGSPRFFPTCHASRTINLSSWHQPSKGE